MAITLFLFLRFSYWLSFSCFSCEELTPIRPIFLNHLAQRQRLLSKPAALRFALGRQPRDHGRKLIDHLRPAEPGTRERPIAPRVREVEAGVLENEARAVAVWFEPEAHPRVDDWSAGRPREHEPTGRFALQHLAVNDQPVKTDLGLRRHAEREVVADTRLEVVGIHPRGQGGVVGDRPPDLLSRLREQDLSMNRVRHSWLLLDRCS